MYMSTINDNELMYLHEYKKMTEKRRKGVLTFFFQWLFPNARHIKFLGSSMDAISSSSSSPPQVSKGSLDSHSLYNRSLSFT